MLAFVRNDVTVFVKDCLRAFDTMPLVFACGHDLSGHVPNDGASGLEFFNLDPYIESCFNPSEIQRSFERIRHS